VTPAALKAGPRGVDFLELSEPKPAASAEPTEIAKRYVVDRKLGAGAFGTVFKAKDKILGRMVAIKTIRLEGLAASGSGLEELLNRFMREAQVSAQLKHPNIVTIYDIGEADGNSYLAMEFIDGVGLEKVIRDSSPLPIERAALIAAQVADALDYAHKNSVVHRDIKPANIMLEAGDRVKVADFGIARVTNSVDHLTATGSLLGTPSYMSPEQARGNELDGRSDLFSVGCVLYEMIAGKRAFRGESITGLIFKVITEEPPALKELRPDVPDAMAKIVAKAMAKTPEARYQTGREFADALLAFTNQGAMPTMRQTETPTESMPEMPGLQTMQADPTLASAPTRVAPPPPIPRAPAAPVSPPAPPRASSAPRAAAMGEASTGRPTRAKSGGAGPLIALLGVGALALTGIAVGGWYYFSQKPATTASNTVATTPVQPPPPSLGTPRPADTPAPVETPPSVASEAPPVATTLAAEVPRPRATPPPPVETTPPVTRPEARPTPRAAAPPESGGDFSHLDDDQTALRGGETRRSGDYGSSSGVYGGSRRVLSKVPPGVAMGERPAVATILYLIGAEEAYNTKHGRYASLKDLLEARTAMLDVAASGNTFARRNYRFRLTVEDDGFKVEAIPSGPGLRPFVGDDTGFVRVGR